jgi:dihydrofolate reductase
MRKVIVSEFVTLDGVFQDPGGAEGFEGGGWAFQFNRGPEGDKFKLDEVMASDALLLGRVTYEAFAEAWPSRTGEFADKFNTMQKYVVSTTLRAPKWNNSVLIKDNVPEEIARLKQEKGGDMLVNGSAKLVQTLMEHDLVDEYRLMVFPVILGMGERLFKEGSDKIALRLVEVKPVGREGVVILIYRLEGK